MNMSDEIRRLHAEGRPNHFIAATLKVQMWRVTQALERGPRRGRPGGNMSLKDQIKYAERIAESADSEQARALAQQLLELLQAEK